MSPSTMPIKARVIHIQSSHSYPIFFYIWQNFHFYRILDNENSKMEVEQPNSVTHLIITVQLYY